MKILIEALPGQLPYLIAAHLEEMGHEVDLNLSNTVDQHFHLYHGKHVSARAIDSLLDQLKPLAPFPIKDERKAENAARLVLPMNQADKFRLHVFADSHRQLGWLQDVVVQGLCMDQMGNQLKLIDANEIHYGSAPAWLRQAIRFVLHKKGGIQAREIRKFSEEDPDIYLNIRDPHAENRPLKDRTKVMIAADDPGLGESFKRILEQKGFSCLPVMTIHQEDLDACFIGVRTGWIEHDYPMVDLNEIRNQIKSFAHAHEVDFEGYPIRMESEDDELDIQVFLPIRACLEKRLRPYAGPFPQRFSVTVLTDDHLKVRDLVLALKNAQFKSVAIDELDKSERIKGFRVGWKSDCLEPSVDIQVRNLLRVALDDQGLQRFAITSDGKYSTLALETDTEIVIACPLRGVQDGQLEAEMSSPANFSLKVIMQDSAGWESYVEKLREFRFESFRTEVEDVSEPSISYGMAPDSLVERIVSVFQNKISIDFEKKSTFSITDNDIYLYLPPIDRVVPDAPKDEKSPERLSLENWLGSAPSESHGCRHFISRRGNRLRIGDVWLERPSGDPHPLSPSEEMFRHFCIDEQTAETLRHIALSINLREPCLLEGKTSTSKTSSVLYMAHLLGQPVFRLNLSGQTDTGDLVGRFVPDDGTNGSGKLGWRWQDGMAVQALKTGAILLLDEVNTPRDPSIPERLNSLLEIPPSLTLAEKDNYVFGPTGEAIHTRFWIAGTMNPARYAGRSNLSPAWRDRWRASRVVPQPGEKEYRQMLDLLVFGKQPAIHCQGHQYRGGKTKAVMANLSAVDNIDPFLDALAAIHASLEKAFGGPKRNGANANGSDPVTFTRRGILSVMEFINWQVGSNGTANITHRIKQALYRYYLQRIADEAAKQAVFKTFEAYGMD